MPKYRNPVLIDAGDMLFKTNRLNPPRKGNARSYMAVAKQKEGARLLLKFYKQMGYKVVGVGQKDLAAGIDFLTDAAKQSGVRFISANILKNNEKIFEPGVIIEAQGVKIGVAAVTSCDAVHYHRGEFQCIPPERALAKILPDLRKKSDFLVLLSNAQDRINIKIAREFPYIDLIIKSGYGNRTYAPIRFAQVPALMTHPKGKAMGIATLKRTGTNEQRAHLQNALVLLTATYETDPEAQKVIDEFKKRFALPKAPRPVKNLVPATKPHAQGTSAPKVK